METTLLIIHAILAVVLIIVVLVQRAEGGALGIGGCLLYTSPSPRDTVTSRMPSSA